MEYGLDDIVGTLHGPETIAVIVSRRFCNRLECQQSQRLHRSVPYCRDAEWALFAIRFWDVYAPERLWAIASQTQVAHPFPFFIRGAPCFAINAGRPFPGVFSDTSDSNGFAGERTRENALKFPDSPPLLLSGCLCNP